MAELPLCGFNLPIKPHHANVHFNARNGTVISILNTACYKCDYWDTCIVDGLNNEISVLTEGTNNFQYRLGNEIIAHGNYTFESFGVYNVTYSYEDLGFNVMTLVESTPFWVTILLTLAVFGVAFIAEIILQCIMFSRSNELNESLLLSEEENNAHSFNERENDENAIYRDDEHLHNRNLDEQNLTQNSRQSNSEIDCFQLGRSQWLDAMRGFALYLMLFVNNGGGGLAQFTHSTWCGLTIADTVFPLFLFCVGCAIHNTRMGLFRYFGEVHWYKISFRTFRLILFGVIVSNPSGDLRLAGVLQRIGVTYFGFIFLRFFFMGLISNLFGLHASSQLQHSFFRNWQIRYLEVFLSVLLTLIYLGINTIPIKGCPWFYQGPGGISEMRLYANCTGGIAGYLDQFFLTNRIYKTPTYMEMYHTRPFLDPEGVLSTLTAMITLTSGFCAYKVLVWHGVQSIRDLVYIAILSLCLSLLLHFTVIPINKNLWNISFVLVNVSIDIAIMIFFILMESRGWRFRIFCALGRYSLFIYIIHEICMDRFPVSINALMNAVPNSIANMMIKAFWAVLFHLLIAAALDLGRFKIHYDISLGLVDPPILP